MKNRGASVAKRIALAAVPLSLAVALANVAVQTRARRAEAATNRLLDSVLIPNNDLTTPALRQFLADGTDVNVSGMHGFAALHHAAADGNTEGIRLLLDSGADINARSADGATPLMSAVLVGQVESVRLLVRLDADVNLPLREAGDDPEVTPLAQARFSTRHFQRPEDVAFLPQFREIIKLLQAAGARE